MLLYFFYFYFPYCSYILHANKERVQGRAGTPVSSQRLGAGRVTDNCLSVGQLSPVAHTLYMYHTITILQVLRARGKPLLQGV